MNCLLCSSLNCSEGSCFGSCVLVLSTNSHCSVQVIVVEDENGNIVRETMKDTDTLARYKTMHETLVYLSHFDHEDTENQMLSKLHLQVNTSSNSRSLYNSLCCEMLHMQLNI